LGYPKFGECFPKKHLAKFVKLYTTYKDKIFPNSCSKKRQKFVEIKNIYWITVQYTRIGVSGSTYVLEYRYEYSPVFLLV
jgi:hypothetical protein